MKLFLSKGWQWPLLVVALLSIPVVANLWLLKQALADTGFAVERDYYRKAVAWDSHVAQLRKNTELGWQAEVRLTPRGHGPVQAVVVVRDRAGQPLQGAHVALRVLHNGHAAQVQEVVAQAAPEGYEAMLALHWAGLHELDLTVTRGAEVFTQTLRRDIAL